MSSKRYTLHSDLFDAAAEGNLAKVKRQLKKGATLEFYDDEDDDTVLHAAVNSGSVKTVQFLLKEARRQEIESLALGIFVDAESLFYGTPLFRAVELGSSAIARVLLAEEANPTLVCMPRGMTAIHMAAVRGDVSFLRQLIDFPPPCISHLEPRDFLSCETEEGVTPLHLAAQKQEVEAVYLLIDADVPLDVVDRYGLTALHYALKDDVSDDRRPKTKRRRNGDTPERLAIVTHLLAHGAKVNAKDEQGQTPLAHARGVGASAIAELLVKAQRKERGKVSNAQSRGTSPRQKVRKSPKRSSAKPRANTKR